MLLKEFEQSTLCGVRGVVCGRTDQRAGSSRLCFAPAEMKAPMKGEHCRPRTFECPQEAGVHCLGPLGVSHLRLGSSDRMICEACSA